MQIDMAMNVDTMRIGGGIGIMGRMCRIVYAAHATGTPLAARRGLSKTMARTNHHRFGRRSCTARSRAW